MAIKNSWPVKTIKDIAKEANVSPGTVDRVLHNRGGVSKKTENIIRKIIKESNFKINKVGSLLALNKNLKIATLIPKFSKEHIFWKAPLMGINTAKEEVSVFGITIYNFTFNQFNTSSYLKEANALIATKPDAVILVPSFKKETQQITAKLEAKKIPYMFLNIDLEGYNNISYIGQDSYKGGYLAGKLMHLSLHNQGAVAIIKTRTNIENNPAFYKRILGFNNYFLEHKIPITCIEENIFNLNDTYKLEKTLVTILKNTLNIKGIYIPNSRVSIFAKCIKKMGYKNIAVIGFDDTEENIKALKESTISFLISQKPFKQGYDAIKLMTRFLMDKKQPDAKVYSPAEILTKENVDFIQKK